MESVLDSSSTLLTDRIGRIAALSEPAARLLNLPRRVVEKEYLALALLFEEPRASIYLGLREARARPSGPIAAVLKPRERPPCPVRTCVREREDGLLEWTINPVQ